MNVKLALKILAIALAVLVLLGGGVYGWASATAANKLSRTFETHSVDFPLPFPLTAGELAQLDIESDEGSLIALERAIERGEHLVEARCVCGECHGRDYGGGVMIHAQPIGTLLGPNITTGR